MYVQQEGNRNPKMISLRKSKVLTNDDTYFDSEDLSKNIRGKIDNIYSKFSETTQY